MQVVGIVLVHNEDVYVEQAIRNVARFCDRIHAVDHRSTDGTWEVLRSLTRELEHLEIKRARHARVSHEVLEPYVGTNTWALRVDGDELYDPEGLERVREPLERGKFDSAFRVQAGVLHCVSLDGETETASGYLSPPSRPITALFNLGAAEAWTGCLERLEGGRISFKTGYSWQTIEPLQDRYSWEDNPLRYLHLCFLRRSSSEPVPPAAPRLSLNESGYYRRGVAGAAVRTIRRPRLDPRVREMHARGSSWKLEKYRRGPLVVKDVSPFLRVA